MFCGVNFDDHSYLLILKLICSLKLKHIEILIILIICDTKKSRIVFSDNVLRTNSSTQQSPGKMNYDMLAWFILCPIVNSCTKIFLKLMIIYMTSSLLMKVLYAYLKD